MVKYIAHNRVKNIPEDAKKWVFRPIMRRHVGKLILREDLIKFTNGFTAAPPVEIQYDTVKYLYVDSCPANFRYHTRDYSIPTDIWTSVYGKYVIGLDKDLKPIFVCSHTEDIWKEISSACTKHGTRFLTPGKLEAMKKEQAL